MSDVRFILCALFLVGCMESLTIGRGDGGSDAPIDVCSTAPECDDMNACTVDTCEPGGMCAHAPLACDDANACTVDSCESTTGCVHRAPGCDDADPCTADGCDATGCVYTPLDCDDANECTVDACGASGCTNVLLDCDDGNECTTDACDAGGCTHVPRDCDDANDCTVDSCDAIGCTHVLRDVDADGFADATCGGTDCDDSVATGAAIHPGAVEVCMNGVDDDCDSLIDVFDVAACMSTEDDCDTVRVLPGPGVYPSSTVGFGDDIMVGCGPSGREDAVFRFTIAETLDVTVSLPDAPDATIVIRTECLGVDVYCAVGSGTRRALPPGTYWLIIELPAPAPYTLELSTAPPAPRRAADTCSTAVNLVPAAGTHTLSTVDLEDDFLCGAPGSIDAVYFFDLAAPATATIDVLGVAGARIDVSPICGTSAGSCRSGPLTTMLDAGRHYVTVETGVPAPFSLSVDITPL